MTLDTLLSITHSGDRIFYRVLCRHFKDKTSEVIDYVINNEYVIKTEGYRCPNCNLLLPKSEDEFCYHCDAELHSDNLSSEPIFIRTDKEFVGDVEVD